MYHLPPGLVTKTAVGGDCAFWCMNGEQLAVVKEKEVDELIGIGILVGR
jgi:hypothetical protein